MSTLFSELKRRNVFKVATAYLVVGWLTLQVFSSVAAPLGFPEWVHSFIIVLIGVGFPIALIFAWAFELTPEGVKKTAEVDKDISITKDTSRKIDYIIIAALVLLVGGMGYERLTLETSSPVVEDAQDALVTQSSASIAVLPFVNMSSDPEQEYFSDGISEEILNVLAKIPNIHITSRSSAFSFKGKDIDIPEVAKKLGVDHVLEGSVRKSGTTVRITAQLIQADGDKHIWSETYDRELDDIFAIQDEISTAIVSQLRKHLGLKENVTIKSNQGLSDNPEAYDAYLMGRYLILQRTNETVSGAIKHYKRALELDPDFALAHAEMATAYALLVDGQYGNLPYEEAYSLAKPHADRAMELAPELPEALAAAGFILWDVGPPEETVTYLEEAIIRSPNHAMINVWLSLVAEERGDYTKALALREKIMALDPLGVTNLNNLSSNYASLGRFSDAEKILSKLASLSPVHYQSSKASIAEYKGDFPAAIHASLSAVKLDPESGLQRIFLGYTLLLLGLEDDAISMVGDAAPSLTASAGHYEGLITDFSKDGLILSTQKKRWLGHSLAAMGKYEEALPLLETVWQATGKRTVFRGGFEIFDAMALIASRGALNPQADISDIEQSIRDDLKRLEDAGYSYQNTGWTKAALAWIDGHYDVAIAHLKEASKSNIILLPQKADYLSALIKEPGYQALSKSIEQRQTEMQSIFFKSVCKDNPYSEVWSPQATDCGRFSDN